MLQQLCLGMTVEYLTERTLCGQISYCFITCCRWWSRANCYSMDQEQRAKVIGTVGSPEKEKVARKNGCVK